MVSWTKGEEEEERRGRGRQKAGRDGNCFDATRRRERKRRGGQGKCKNRADLRRARYAGAYLVWTVWHGTVGMGWQLRWSPPRRGTLYLDVLIV